MVHHSTCLLLLLLTCQMGVSNCETQQGETMEDTSYGPSSATISGVDIVTVGILYGFQCTAECYPGCQYNWTLGNMTAQGADLSLELKKVLPTQTLTCIAINTATGKTETVQKTLRVTAGPSDIQITGPPALTFGVKSTFNCSADCYPSCSYSWMVLLDDETFQTTQGSTISVSPPESTVNSETLVCVAKNTVSNLFISTVQFLWVASVSSISITGDNNVVMGQQYTFICFATCVPSCDFTWKYNGKTFSGDKVQIPILEQKQTTEFTSHLEITFSDYSKTEPLTCEAKNTITGAVITTTKNLSVSDPISVKTTSQEPPLAGKSFSLQCVGSQNPKSITWLKNKDPMPESGDVTFSSDNITMTFSPLMQTDDGVYQCVVDEGSNPIQSVGYEMQVNYGPVDVQILKPNKGPVGGEIFTLPGSTTELQCSADCFPACSFKWFYEGELLATNASISFTPVAPPQEASLSCVAFNSVTEQNGTAETSVTVPDGPSDVQILQPGKGAVGGEIFTLPGSTTELQCSADCVPACSFKWFYEGELLATNASISFTPVAPPNEASLSCVAFNSETEQNRTAETTVIVPDGPSDVQILKPNKGAVGGEIFTLPGSTTELQCSADCFPACSFKWFYEGELLATNASISFTPVAPPQEASLSCVAFNSVTEQNGTAETTVIVSDGPVDVQILQPGKGAVGGEIFTLPGSTTELQCSADCVPACSFKWFYEGELLATNASISFTPVAPPNEASLSCVAFNSETEQNRTAETTVIVPDGPSDVQILQPNKGAVGGDIVTLPGSTTELQCSADCVPACSFKWFYEGELLATNASISFTPVAPPQEASLSCVAFNSVTEQNGTAETTVIVPDGPKNVVISGPDSLEVGITASFTCSAECTPSCSFTWNLYGKTMTGGTIDITVNRYISTEFISCQAENTFTKEMVTVNETLSVSDPHWCGC